MEGPNKKTPEEIAEIEKSRALSDAELLNGGAEYAVSLEGEKTLKVTGEQREKIEKDMIAVLGDEIKGAYMEQMPNTVNVGGGIENNNRSGEVGGMDGKNEKIMEFLAEANEDGSGFNADGVGGAKDWATQRAGGILKGGGDITLEELENINTIATDTRLNILKSNVKTGVIVSTTLPMFGFTAGVFLKGVGAGVVIAGETLSLSAVAFGAGVIAAPVIALAAIGYYFYKNHSIKKHSAERLNGLGAMFTQG